MRLRTLNSKISFIIAAIAIVAIVVIDRLLKLVAYQDLVMNNSGSGFFVPTINEGIAFGITIAPSLVLVGSLVIIIGLLISLVHFIFKQRWLEAASIFAILIGASSNFWDRVQYGFVIDYLLLPLTHINLADALITVGALGLCVKFLLGDIELKKEAVPPLLLKALPYAPRGGRALDLGAGVMDESRYLLNQGYQVTAVDKDPDMRKFADKIKNAQFQFAQNSFEDFYFLPANYNLILALWSLPFIKDKSDLIQVVTNIKASLRPQGIFVATFIGQNDTWCINERPMTFVTRQEVEALFSDMEAIFIGEREYDGENRAGIKKHWHVIPVIVKRIN